jgi:hypothetical protein
VIVLSARMFPSVTEPRDLHDVVRYTCEFIVAPQGATKLEVTANDQQAEWRPIPPDEETPTVLFENLDIFSTQSLRLPDGTLFKPFIENSQRFDIGDGERATFAEHLAALFQRLLNYSPFRSQPTELRCFYGHRLGGQEIVVPVVLVPRQDVSASDHALFEQIGGALRQWLETIQPGGEDGRIVLDVTCWSALPDVDALLVKLPQLSLSMSLVV